jgi:hypothetical protein
LIAHIEVDVAVVQPVVPDNRASVDQAPCLTLCVVLSPVKHCDSLSWPDLLYLKSVGTLLSDFGESSVTMLIE